MTGDNESSFTLAKGELRRQIKAKRQNQPDKEAVSERILSHVLSLPPYEKAKVVLWYLDVRDEVRTRDWLLQKGLKLAKHAGQQIVVPWCEGDQLRLFFLSEPQQLVVGKFGIFEPAMSLRENPVWNVLPQTIDLAIIPGVAFDRRGGRLGHGAGYYDRLLADLRPDCLKVGVGYACQLVEEVPCLPHDVLMDVVITEDGKITCKEKS